MDRTVKSCVLLAILLIVTAAGTFVTEEDFNEYRLYVEDRLKKQAEDMKKQVDGAKTQLETKLNSTIETLTTTQKELKSTQNKLKTTQKELKSTQNKLKTTQKELKSTQNMLKTAQKELKSTKNRLKTTQKELASTKTTLVTTREDLIGTKDMLVTTMRTTQKELNSTNDKLTTTQKELTGTKDMVATEMNNTKQLLEGKMRASQQTVQSVQDSLRALRSDMKEQCDLRDSGSTFTRWGRTTCPKNTSLVYTGTVAGSYWEDKGGASNYLCRVTNPQLDDQESRGGNYLKVTVYKLSGSRRDQGAVCSVCRAPQATTLMVPATLTCPKGWTSQYKGFLVSEHRGSEGRTQYVCLDQNSEHRDIGLTGGEHANFYRVSTSCDTLPCPLGDNFKFVTCVVCSK